MQYRACEKNSGNQIVSRDARGRGCDSGRPSCVRWTAALFRPDVPARHNEAEMKALVAVKRVVDYNVKVRVKADKAPTTPHMIAIGWASRRKPRKNEISCSCTIVWCVMS